MNSRIRNEMDGVRNKDQEPGWQREDIDLIESQPKQTCGLCHATGIIAENVCSPMTLPQAVMFHTS